MSKIRKEIEKQRNEIFTMSDKDFKLEIIDWLNELLGARHSSALQLDYTEVARLEACIDRILPNARDESFLDDYV